MCVSLSLSLFIYIYIEREREIDVSGTTGLASAAPRGLHSDTSHRVVLRRIVPYHTASNPNFVSSNPNLSPDPNPKSNPDPILSYAVSAQRSTAQRITSHRTASYPISSRHVTSHCITPYSDERCMIAGIGRYMRTIIHAQAHEPGESSR